MTHKEENIVNIAMRAAELLKDGKIERSDITGHAGLTDTIIGLAEVFEQKNAGVDFDTENRDYWEEIDAFAEENLLRLYGRDEPGLDPSVETYALPDYPVKVFAVSGPVRHEIYSGDWDECSRFYDEHGGRFLDENEFEWDLDVVDERENTFPEGYYDALDHYSQICNANIENEFLRQHAQRLVTCYQNKAEYAEFIAWARFEDLLGEKLTLQEACALFRETDINPYGDSAIGQKAIHELKALLDDCRAAGSKRPSLDLMIHSASDKASSTTVDQSEKALGNRSDR